jgi:CRISPR system Cascade subunit CasE
MVPVVVPLHFSKVVLARPPKDVYVLHQLLWKAFDSKERPFLFRADAIRTEDGGRMVVLAQSMVEARWSALDGSVLNAEQVYRQVRLSAGDDLRFFLRANPTISRKGRNEPKFKDVEGEAFRDARGRRVALLAEDARLQWLHKKAASAGFKVIGVRTSNARPWRWNRSGIIARHDGVDFEGSLRIEDPAKLRDALLRGIGTAKAFGFGLLSLARLS